MNILDDVNYEIAILRSNIADTYNASTEASARADFVAAAAMLEAADDLQQELRAALDFRADLLGDMPCDTCDGDQCSNCYYDVSVRVDPTDMDQSYQLDVLLNELNVMGAPSESCIKFCNKSSSPWHFCLWVNKCSLSFQAVLKHLPLSLHSSSVP